jgi:uncharacterized protein (DUF2336 family)
MAAQKPARAQELIDLARHDGGQDRAQLYGRIAELFQVEAARRSESELALLVEIMRALSTQVDMRLRLALAERLADRGDADHNLLLLLAHDEIEVAGPVIMRSVVLTEADLVGIIQECSPKHSVQVARRPAITPRVCEALVETNHQDVFRTLSRNKTAELAPRTLERLVEISQSDPALTDALVARPNLPKGLAIRMFSWASSALKHHIAERFDIDPAVLEAELARSVSEELSKRQVPDGRAKMLHSLVDKLRASGQLKPGFLLKAAREGQMDIFRIAFARLLEVDQATMDVILDGKNIVQLARATRAAGIDRSAFPAVVEKLCGANALAELAEGAKADVDAALNLSPPSLAREALLSV